jgi:hypothetical protein
MVVCLPLPLDRMCTAIRSPLAKISTGEIHLGMAGEIISEWRAASLRNQHPS